MNVIYILVLIVIKIAVAADVSPPSGASKFDKFILERCTKYSTDLVSYDDVKDDLDKFTDYLKLSFSQLPREKNDFCQEKKTALHRLMRELAKEFSACLPKEEKYLPKFMYESFNEFLFFLCEDNGKNIDSKWRAIERPSLNAKFADFFSTAASQCLDKLKNHTAGNEVSNCFRKITAPLDSIVPKDRLCDDIDTAKKCFSETIKRHCPEVPAFESLNSRFFKAIRTPCTKSAAVTWGISSFVLLASVLIHKVIL